jgi:hypothetical protein
LRGKFLPARSLAKPMEILLIGLCITPWLH